jgi:hypothetical protein
MDAQLNNTILNWTQQYHGLLRRLEKNRFLLIFEKRDLKRAVEAKFSILEEINQIIKRLRAVFQKEDAIKSDIIDVLSEFLPNFHHIDTGKGLDGRM